MRITEMTFDQKIYLRDMQVYNDYAYFARYEKNHIGKPPGAPGGSLIDKAKEIKNHAK